MPWTRRTPGAVSVATIPAAWARCPRAAGGDEMGTAVAGGAAVARGTALAGEESIVDLGHTSPSPEEVRSELTAWTHLRGTPPGGGRGVLRFDNPQHPVAPSLIAVLTAPVRALATSH